MTHTQPLRIITMIIPLAAMLVSSCSQPPISAGHDADIDPLFAAYDGDDMPGASVLVLSNGMPVFQKTYGSAVIEEHVKITPQTNFRLASMTKQFTAMCIMMLKEEGRLSYGDRVTKFLPGIPSYCSTMTVKQLLTHTSGLPDYESLIPDTQTVQVKDADIPALLHKADSTLFPPGTKYSYSNTGYALLALIVEKISGAPFREFLERRIFAPLEMRTTIAFEDGINTVEERAYGYSRTPLSAASGGNADARFVRDDQSVTSAVLGDGGIYSNVMDLAKWDAALYSDRLVSRASLEEAFADAALSDGTTIDYGYGWHKETFLDIRHPYHDGSTRGFRNTILRFPSERLTVMILTNRNEGDPRSIAKKIAAIFLKKSDAFDAR
ncbi:MAG: serine hydrolase domain-containing protein [Acidobacteriota bacterium]